MSKRSIDIDSLSNKKIRLSREQHKRKSTNDIVTNIKRLKIYTPEYVCVIHDNDRDICSIYDCSGSNVVDDNGYTYCL